MTDVSVNGLITDYFETYILALQDFRISRGSSINFDQEIIDEIEKMLSLKDDFIEFTFTVFKFQDSVDIEKFHGFFEELIKFNWVPEAISNYTDTDCDNYKFFTYELILNFIAILIKLKKYKEAGFFINSEYFYKHRHRVETLGKISIFNTYVQSLDDYRNKRLNLLRISITADLIKAHSIRTDITFDDIKQADLILFYILELKRSQWEWFPRTSVYNSHYSIDVFSRLVSRKHFEKIKCLFDVDTVDDLKNLITENIAAKKDSNKNYSYWNYNIIAIDKIIDVEKIGSIN